MNFRKRLKAAIKSLIAQPETRTPLVQNQELNPLVVMDNRLLSGKNVLITGAGRNIGRSIAIEMAKQGANVFLPTIIKDDV